MKKPRVLFLFIILLMLPLVCIGAADFGLILYQFAGVGNTSSGGDTLFDYSATALPRFSFLVGDTGSFFVSAGMTFEYAYEEPYFFTELMRTEFSALFGAVGVRAGRFEYSTPMPVIAEGLFDGFQITHTSETGIFGLGIWYTGLLYKKNLTITMTTKDAMHYNKPVDIENLADTYFTSKRMLISADWEHPSILEMFSLKAAITGQFDLNDKDAQYNSQYLTLKADIPVSRFLFELGGSMEISQSYPEIDGASNIALAGELGIICALPTSFNSRLAFNTLFTSGKAKDGLDAFVPITTKQYGIIFQSKIMGLTVMSLDYSARIAQSLGAGITASYFIRNNLVRHDAFPVYDAGEYGHFLGGEFSGQLVWSLISDIQLIFGGGAFIPAIGNNWPNSNPVWRANLLAIFSVL
ncbi:MAG: hypothetical protein LBU66_05565 [Treponema sp.]|jgi:hypothetical protein|nr:hypothetical protein [Treponema sp.]